MSPRHLLRTVLVLALTVTALALPGSALAASCETNLVDTFGYTSDMESDGSIGDGFSSTNDDAFDGYGDVSWDGLGFSSAATDSCTLEDGGRELVYPAEDINGISVSRKAYVPVSGLAFTRLTTLLTNPGTSPVTATYYFYANLGSDGDSHVIATSSGDALVTDADDWASSDDVPGGVGTPDDPTLAHAWQGANAAERASMVNFVDGGGSFEFEYTVTLAAGETKAYVHFVAMRDTVEQATAAASTLHAGSAETWAAMTLAELGLVRNWKVTDLDFDGVLNATDNCVGVANADQLNTDGDATGNACDSDDDNDGWDDTTEVIIGTDPLKSDTDGDSVGDKADRCPVTAGASADGCGIATAEVLPCPTGTSAGVVCLQSSTGSGLLLVGSSDADTLVGTTTHDTLFGGGGADRINGAGGGDVINGDAGADTLLGGAGNDVLRGGGGNDVIRGGGGADLLDGNAGDDRIFGGAGDDRANAGAGNDTAAGEAGADWLSGGLGNDRLTGGLGLDRLFGGRGRNTIVQ